jgi:TonB-linked SusC/RagA family outer membrane protein
MTLAQRTVTGMITDNSGLALIGANVTLKGTTTGVITDIDGNYSIEIPAGEQTLVFSYTGFTTQEIAVGDRSTIDVVLAEGVLLNEIVKVGYSDVARNKMIASVAQVNADKIENIPLTDVNQLLQGNAAGVYTTANSGQPGAAQQVRIRGIGSLTGGNQPLYVIDGVPVSQGNFSQIDGASNATDVLAQLNPNDIENMTVLKDASATALYGSRGANGVILITTKRGKAGKTDLQAKFQYGNTSPSFGNFELMTAQQQWDYEREILANSGRTQEQIDGARPATLLDDTFDWLDAAFGDGQTFNAELQASGGDEKTRFFVSGGYFDQEGILFLSGFKRMSGRANLDHKATDKLNFSVNFNASYSENSNAVNGNRFQSPIAQAFTTTPMQSAYQSDGTTLFTGLEDNWGAAVIGDNFLYSLPLNPVDINTLRIISKVEMNYDILDNLKFTQTANIDWINIDELNFDDPTTNDGVNLNGTVDNAFTNNRTYTTQSLLKYFTDFGADHSIDVLAGFEFQGSDDNRFRATGQGLASGKLKTLNSTAEPNFVGGSKTKFSFVSYLSQINYSFRDKYLLSASLRRDGSSRFGSDNRWANFWSIGGSWNLTEESFLADNGFFDELRLRGSYGTSGNAAIGNFNSQELYGFGSAYLNQPGSVPTQIANPALTWEESTTLNVGMDFAVLSNKVSGSVEYYVKKSEGNLLNVPVSSTSGFTSALQNVGEIENSGVEVNFNLYPVTNPDGFSWTISGNFAANDNKILSLPEGEDILPGNSQLWREGFATRTFFMQEWAGVNPADGTPLWRTEEGGVTGNYGQADRLIVGSAIPDFTAGLTNTFTFKNVTFSTFFYTAQGHEIYNASKSFLDSDGRRFGWVHITDALDHWKQPGDISERPQPLSGGNAGAANTSSRYLEDGSFIRLRNVLLGYRLPSSITEKLKLGGVNVYVQGVNLLTITDYSGIDPEADEDGNEFFRYPVGKSLTFGLDINF